jgi:hypothetical protein
MSRVTSPGRIALTLAAVLTGVLAVVGLGPAAAQAAPWYTVRLVPGTNPFVFMEVRGASMDSLAWVDVWSYTGGSNQVWIFQPVGDKYEIVNQNSGRCLWTDGVAGDQLRQAPCTGSQYVLWQTNLKIDGHNYPIRNPASDLYVDLAGNDGTQGTPIVGRPWNGGLPNQEFFAYAA